MKEIKIADIIQTGFIILSIGLAGWYLKADISKEINQVKQELKQEISILEQRIEKRFEQIDKRFDRIEMRLDRMEQNHLEHIINLHANTDKTKKE